MFHRTENLAVTLHHMTSLYTLFNLAFSAFSKHTLLYFAASDGMPSIHLSADQLCHYTGFNDKLIIAGNRQAPLHLRYKQNIRRLGEENALHQPHRAHGQNQGKLQSSRKRICLPDLGQRTVSSEYLLRYLHNYRQNSRRYTQF